MLEECNASQWYAAMPRRLPVYLLAGDRDPVGAMGSGPREVYQGLLRAGCQDVELRLWPGGRHEMLNETEQEEVRRELLAWLEKVMARRALDPMPED